MQSVAKCCAHVQYSAECISVQHKFRRLDFMRLGSAVSDLGFLVLQGLAQSDELSILAVHSRL